MISSSTLQILVEKRTRTELSVDHNGVWLSGPTYFFNFKPVLAIRRITCCNTILVYTALSLGVSPQACSLVLT